MKQIIKSFEDPEGKLFDEIDSHLKGNPMSKLAKQISSSKEAMSTLEALGYTAKQGAVLSILSSVNQPKESPEQ
jgi:Holliday junction resolvasome RuvABC DNA-binding subunit